MRCNWRRWLWGLIPLALVSWAALEVERGRIEQDLAERAKQALIANGLAWANVEFNGRDAMVIGGAIQESEPVKAEETLRTVWGVREVDNRASLPPRIEPFVWSARWRGNRIRLHGYVADRSTRRTVLGLTKAVMPGLEVADRMNVARGIPPVDTWLAGVSFALKQLASLKRGDVRFDDLTLTISGEAEDTAAYRSVNAALKTGLPKGIRLASAQIAAPVASPFTWSAEFAGGQLVLSGYVPSEGARTELLGAAKAASPGTNVVDRMEVAEGAPQGWVDMAVAVSRELVRLDNGNARTKDSALTVAGVAVDEPTGQQVRAALRSASLSAFKVTDQVRVREPVKPPEPLAPRAEPATPVAEPQPKVAAPAPPPEPEPKVATLAPPPPAEPQPKVATPAPQAEPQPKVTAPVSPPPAEPAPKVTAPAPPSPAEPQPKVAAAPTPQPMTPVPQALAVCEESLSKIAASGQILFNRDSATLEGASLETLDRLAAAAKGCPGVRIAVEGHADIEGSTDHNQRLSVRRAQAVVAHLIKAGADAQRLEAVGFGASRPAAPNDSVENKAKNRRIEIIVRRP